MSPCGLDKTFALLTIMIQKLLAHKKIRALNSRKECHQIQDLTSGANILGLKLHQLYQQLWMVKVIINGLDVLLSKRVVKEPCQSNFINFKFFDWI
jgi:hypothetical protein